MDRDSKSKSEKIEDLLHGMSDTKCINAFCYSMACSLTSATPYEPPDYNPPGMLISLMLYAQKGTTSVGSRLLIFILISVTFYVAGPPRKHVKPSTKSED
mgnify:CR=1 FL=1